MRLFKRTTGRVLPVSPTQRTASRGTDLACVIVGAGNSGANTGKGMIQTLHDAWAIRPRNTWLAGLLQNGVADLKGHASPAFNVYIIR